MSMRHNDEAVSILSPSWIKLIVSLGVSTVISLFLVYQIAYVRREQMDRMEALLIKHESARASDMLRENAFLYAICLNTASDDTERARCLVAIESVTPTDLNRISQEGR
jgi:hypothetical protein